MYTQITQLVKNSPDAGDTSSVPGLVISPGEGIAFQLQYLWSFLVAQMVKNMTAVEETRAQFLDQEDPLQNKNGYTFQYFYSENPMGRGAWQAMI